MAGPAISAALSPGRLLARPARHLKCPCSDRVLLTAVHFLRRMTWRLPDTYHLADHGPGTATLRLYEGRDILSIISWGRRDRMPRPPVQLPVPADWPRLVSGRGHSAGTGSFPCGRRLASAG